MHSGPAAGSILDQQPPIKPLLPPSASAGGVPLWGWAPPTDATATPAPNQSSPGQVSLFGGVWSIFKTVLWFAFLYIAIGSAINYSVFHRSGLEAIPHSQLWLQGPSNLIDQIMYHGTLFTRRSGLTKDSTPLQNPGGYQDFGESSFSQFQPHKN